MNVGKLLQLERALESGRVVHTATEEQEVAGRVVPVGERADLRLLAQHRVDERRQVKRFGEQPPAAIGVDRAAPLREVDREQVEIHQHRGVRLRRCHGDLRPGVQVDDVVGHATGFASHHVHDAH